MEVIGVTSYGDLSSFAQQQSRASRLHPLDRRRGARRRHARGGREDGRAAAQVREGDPLPQRRHPDLPLRRDAHLAPHPERRAARAARLHSHVRGHAGIRRALHRARGEDLPRQPRAAVFPRAGPLRAGRLVFVALPRAFGRRRVPEEPGRARCSTSSSARTCCAPTCATRSTSSASCSTTPGRSRRPSATRRASSTAITCSSSPTARRPRTRWSGITRSRRATS